MRPILLADIRCGRSSDDILPVIDGLDERFADISCQWDGYDPSIDDLPEATEMECEHILARLDELRALVLSGDRIAAMTLLERESYMQRPDDVRAAYDAATGAKDAV